MARDALTLLRAKNSVMVGFAVIVGEIVAARAIPPIDKAITGFLVGFLISGAAMVVNDIFDIEVDRVNAPHRPLVRGTISLRTAALLATAFYVTGVLLSLLLSPLNAAIALAFALLSLVYSYRLKEEGLIGNVAVSLSVAVPYVFGGVAVGSLRTLVVILALISFVANLGREILKGVPDMPGDAVRRAKTLARRRGAAAACTTAALCIIVAVLASFVPAVVGLTGFFYLPAILLADALLLHAAISILYDHSPSVALKAKDEILRGMAVGLFAFLIAGMPQ